MRRLLLSFSVAAFALLCIALLPSLDHLRAQTTTKPYISNVLAYQGYTSGFVNKFRNGTFNVWQRGTSSLATGSSAPGNYTADGWRVYQPGAQATCSLASAGGFNEMGCVGITSNTDTQYTQRIESYVSAQLVSPDVATVVTFQVQFYQNTGSSVTPKLSACYASVQDTFTTCTNDITAVSLTACATATLCTESYTWTASATAVNGYQVTFDCNTALTAAQTCYVANADIRPTPGATCNGTAPPCVQTNPPPAELRPYPIELDFCQRYLPAYNFAGPVPGNGVVSNGTSAFMNISFPRPARASITGWTTSAASTFNLLLPSGSTVAGSSVAFDSGGVNGATVTVNVSSGLTSGYSTVLTLGSGGQILFTGAEL